MKQEIANEDLYKAIMEVQQELHELKRSIIDNEATEADIQFSEGTRQAQKEIDEGKGIVQSQSEFSKEMNSW